MMINSQHQGKQQTGALVILFVLLAALAIVIVLLAAFVIPDTVSATDPVQDVGWTTTQTDVDVNAHDGS